VSGSPPATRPWFAEFVLLAAIWGSSFLFTRLAVVEFGALPTAGVRVAIASLFLLPLLLMRGHGRELRQHWKAVFLVGLLNSGLPFACFAFALLYLTTGLSAILNATVPLFGALVAWAWLKDRPDASRILGLFIGFAGVALLASDKAGVKAGPAGAAAGLLDTWGPALGIAACLLATLCYGISASYTKRYLGGLPSLVTATGSQIGATLGTGAADSFLLARSYARSDRLAGPARGRRALHGRGLRSVFPPDRSRRSGSLAHRDLRRAGVCPFLRQRLPQ
jgi:drug/metabolite transporter (DMT)-like permease